MSCPIISVLSIMLAAYILRALTGKLLPTLSHSVRPSLPKKNKERNTQVMFKIRFTISFYSDMF